MAIDNKLDEKGFVFMRNREPFYIRIWQGVPMLFYWHQDQRWVTVRQVNQTEIWQAAKLSIPEKEAEEYHIINERNW